MLLRPDQQKVHKMLSEAITMLCRNGLDYDVEFRVEGLLGITLDSREVFLVNIQERVLSEETEVSGTQTAQHNVLKGAQTAQTDEASPFTGYERRQRQQCDEGIISGALTPMMTEFRRPFRRHHGRQKFRGELRGMRKRYGQPNFRMMHEILASGGAHPQLPMDFFSKDFGNPPFAKRQHLAHESPDHETRQAATSTTTSDAIKENPTTTESPVKVKVEPIETEGVKDLMIDESHSQRYGNSDNMELGEESVGSPWQGLPYTETQGARARTSRVGAPDNLNEIFEDVAYMDPGLIARIKKAIMKEDGCFVTTRMLCRRYSAFFKSHMVVDAMKIITVPKTDPQHIGVFRSLKERSKVFFKCPPDKINPEALKDHNMTLQQYEESFFRMPHPKGMHTPKWDIFVQYVLESSPYGPMKPAELTKVMEERLDVEPGTTMDEFELQHYIIHSEGCFVSSRILCRRLSKQYKVVNVIRAMKAMSRPPSDPNYVGQFIKVSERIKIFFKAPPHMISSEACRLYNMADGQYKQLYYASPRPWDGSVTNWDAYVESIAARYPFSFEDFPLDSCDVSPEVADRIRNMFSVVQPGESTDYDPGLTSLVDMMNNASTNSLSVSDAQESEDTVERIRNMFGAEVVAGLPPPVSVLDVDLEDNTEASRESTDISQKDEMQ